MKHLFYVFILIVSALFITLSCDDSKEELPVNSSPVIDLPDFPQSVGSYWVYEAFDSVHQSYDTFTISISDTATLATLGKFATVWDFPVTPREMGFLGNDVYIVIPDSLKNTDTIRVYGKHDAVDPWFIQEYVFPFETDNFWLSTPEWELFADSFHVMDTTSFQYHSDLLTTVLGIKKFYNCGDECSGRLEFLFKNQIGFLQFSITENDLMEPPDRQIKAVWKLIDYHIEEM